MSKSMSQALAELEEAVKRGEAFLAEREAANDLAGAIGAQGVVENARNAMREQQTEDAKDRADQAAVSYLASQFARKSN